MVNCPSESYLSYRRNIPLVQRQDAVLGVEKHVLLFRHGFSPHNISAFRFKIKIKKIMCQAQRPTPYHDCIESIIVKDNCQELLTLLTVSAFKSWRADTGILHIKVQAGRGAMARIGNTFIRICKILKCQYTLRL